MICELSLTCPTDVRQITRVCWKEWIGIRGMFFLVFFEKPSYHKYLLLGSRLERNVTRTAIASWCGRGVGTKVATTAIGKERNEKRDCLLMQQRNRDERCDHRDRHEHHVVTKTKVTVSSITRLLSFF